MPLGPQDAKHSVVGLTMTIFDLETTAQGVFEMELPWLMKVITRPLDNALVIQFHNVQQNLCSPRSSSKRNVELGS
jgi:hypothetical protein